MKESNSNNRKNKKRKHNDDKAAAFQSPVFDYPASFPLRVFFEPPTQTLACEFVNSTLKRFLPPSSTIDFYTTSSDKLIAVHDFLDKTECKELLELLCVERKRFWKPSFVQIAAAATQQPSAVNDDNKHMVSHESRTSQTQFLGSFRKHRRHIITTVMKRMQKLFESSTHRVIVEPIGCNWYTVNQQFDLHHDACELNDEYHPVQLHDISLTRAVSCLLYLNDDFTGGETTFPKLNTTVEPKQGTMLVWLNGKLSDGSIDDQVVHAGKPVETNEKFCCNFWISFKPVGSFFFCKYD